MPRRQRRLSELVPSQRLTRGAGPIYATRVRDLSWSSRRGRWSRRGGISSSPGRICTEHEYTLDRSELRIVERRRRDRNARLARSTRAGSGRQCAQVVRGFHASAARAGDSGKCAGPRRAASMLIIAPSAMAKKARATDRRAASSPSGRPFSGRAPQSRRQPARAPRSA